MEAAALPHEIRVLIADDHRPFAEALAGILVAEPQIDVVAIAGDGSEAVELVTSLEPDVTLMDISMPVMDGFEATRQIRDVWPTACIVMLTGSDARDDVNRARTAGAAGYVTKDRVAVELVEVILEIGSR